MVRLACERHLRDLKQGPARGLRWDPAAARRAINFFGFLQLGDGAFEGKPFNLERFQQFIVGNLFGWKGADGFRRFRTAYNEIGKGNGKSPLAGGVGLYGLVADQEAGAEIYSAATTREQAGILFRDAKRLADSSAALKGRLKIDLANISFPATDSFFRPVSSEHKGLDGKRPHMALIDELHEHPTPLVVDKMRAGTKSRRQALVFEITNSGWDRTSVCWAHHEYSRKVLEQQIENDSWFAYVCSLDPCEKHLGEGKMQPVDGCPDCDDWKDEKVWPKANPGLGSIITLKYLREQVEEAKGMPSKEGIVKRLNFCWWTEGETAWLPVVLWSRGKRKVDAPLLRKCVCYGGLDIASKTDLAAFILIFPDKPEPGYYSILAWHWMPRDSARARETNEGIPYLAWERAGLITLTEGDVIDQDVIEEAVKEIAVIYQIKDVGYDPWNATQLALHLQEHGIEMVEFAQNIRNFNEPTKLFESLLKEGKLLHGDNPLLNWQAGNVTVITDRSGNIRPVKPEHNIGKKVDGIVAGVMALGRSIVNPGEESWYVPGILTN